MQILFIYINPTGRTAVPPNISLLIGNLKAKTDHLVEVFDTSFYPFDLGEPKVKAAWSSGYFVPVVNNITIPPKKENMMHDLDQMVQTIKPDLIAVSCYSNQFEIVCRILSHLKNHYSYIPNIVGGAHPSFVPEEVIKKDFVDMICVGEGEDMLIDLCDCIDNSDDYSSLPGLWLKKDGKIIRNPIGRPTDLNQLGAPDWTVFAPEHIYQPFHGRYYRTGMIEFGRGCPNHCTYCANNEYLNIYKNHKASYFRHRNPQKFISYLKEFKNKWELELIYFQDGTFLTMPLRVLQELADLYQKEIDIPCIILTTATTINDATLKCLKKMRCVYINLGIEEGNPEFRKKVLRRNMSDSDIIKAFKLIRDYGIYSAAYNVIGFPFETREDIFKTIELNKECQPDSVYVQIFYPIAGCELYDLCLKEGYFDRSNETLHSQILDMGNVSLLDNLEITRQEIHNLIKTFYLYVRMDKEHWPFIEMLEEDTPSNRKIIEHFTNNYWKKEPSFIEKESLESFGR
ncbi:MAG: B12-binding domain-containing radical SAM protein [Proteobacteria bacterium]|nr:B12-binding domain-containing radical SAM protein [Pseudomonadota bacterium]MBU1389473.1 B12-binding domain-containing radical SAM protein [Pseudomonadota bacterium]MBU1541293.1 B12-binding domain-containing radical SAM protein [Pseudomonadota bacterium]